MDDITEQHDQAVENAFEPMPLSKIETFTLKQLIEEHQFAAQSLPVEDPRRNSYLRMLSAIATFRFQDIDWDDALLDHIIAQSAHVSADPPIDS